MQLLLFLLIQSNVACTLLNTAPICTSHSATSTLAWINAFFSASGALTKHMSSSLYNSLTATRLPYVQQYIKSAPESFLPYDSEAIIQKRDEIAASYSSSSFRNEKVCPSSSGGRRVIGDFSALLTVSDCAVLSRHSRLHDDKLPILTKNRIEVTRSNKLKCHEDPEDYFLWNVLSSVRQQHLLKKNMECSGKNVYAFYLHCLQLQKMDPQTRQSIIGQINYVYSILYGSSLYKSPPYIMANWVAKQQRVAYRAQQYQSIKHLITPYNDDNSDVYEDFEVTE